MNYLSVCSGIEAATVAWHDIGWTPAGFSEIEPFPSAVLANHYPDITNFGDMTKFKEWNLDPDGVDLLVGGTPCQSFSVAGLRKGLDDPRGNLALVYCSMLDHFRPKWFVWENVPGVLSSSGGRDFGSFLGAVAELGYGFSYRVLDAQYFGVAQRRRRVFVVGHLGDWRPSAAVLFERESLRRDTAPGREAGKEVTGATAQCFDRQSSGEYGTAPVASTMSARDYKSASDLVAQPMPINTMIALRHNALGEGTGFGIGDAGSPAYTITKGHSHAVAYGIPGNWIGRKPENGGNAVEPMHDMSPCLTKTDRHGVAQPMTLAPTLTASNDPSRSPQSTEITNQVASVYEASMAVRRLTPVECERLQGFPDNYTNIPWRKKEESPDGPRYKALGNSMAVPVMRWIGERINQVKEIA